ncbi:MAG: hypothetical protein QOH50_1745 [Kribbellaceae bacterium]|nr:hypothetical protein [Kribbellaceae bacterium]
MASQPRCSCVLPCIRKSRLAAEVSVGSASCADLCVRARPVGVGNVAGCGHARPQSRLRAITARGSGWLWQRPSSAAGSVSSTSQWIRRPADRCGASRPGRPLPLRLPAPLAGIRPLPGGTRRPVTCHPSSAAGAGRLMAGSYPGWIADIAFVHSLVNPIRGQWLSGAPRRTQGVERSPTPAIHKPLQHPVVHYPLEYASIRRPVDTGSWVTGAESVREGPWATPQRTPSVRRGGQRTRVGTGS